MLDFFWAFFFQKKSKISKKINPDSRGSGPDPDLRSPRSWPRSPTRPFVYAHQSPSSWPRPPSTQSPSKQPGSCFTPTNHHPHTLPSTHPSKPPSTHTDNVRPQCTIQTPFQVPTQASLQAPQKTFSAPSNTHLKHPPCHHSGMCALIGVGSF